MITLPASSRSFRGSHPSAVAAHQRPSGRSHSARNDRSTITSPTVETTRSRTQISPGTHGAIRNLVHHNHSPPALTSARVQISASGRPRRPPGLAVRRSMFRHSTLARLSSVSRRSRLPLPSGEAGRSIAVAILILRWWPPVALGRCRVNPVGGSQVRFAATDLPRRRLRKAGNGPTVVGRFDRRLTRHEAVATTSDAIVRWWPLGCRKRSRAVKAGRKSRPVASVEN